MARPIIISDEQIISLYLNGYSQKDIVAKYKISANRTRTVLKEAGYDTSGFRTLHDRMKQVIRVLAISGVYYLDLERVSDISIHAIRDYMHLNPQFGVRATLPPKRRNLLDEDTVKQSFPIQQEFLAKYDEGDSFCALAELYKFTDADVMYAYYSIQEGNIRAHQAALLSRILEDQAAGMSTSGIARKHIISRSLVKSLIK